MRKERNLARASLVSSLRLATRRYDPPVLSIDFLDVMREYLCTSASNTSIVQTGQIVAIKKIHLGNAKEVCPSFQPLLSPLG